MKDKLLAALKLKFPGASDATLIRIAEKKAGSVTEESQIEKVVETISWDVVVQSEVDFRITDANKKAVQNYEEKHKLKDGKPIETGKKTDTTSVSTEDMPPWAKTLVESNNELKAKLEVAESRSKQTDLAAKLHAKLKEKKIPEKQIPILTAGRVIDDESKIDAIATEVETAWNEIKQDIINSSAPELVPGGGIPPTTTAQVTSAIKDWRQSKGLPAEVQTKKEN